jgi:glycosyltransferase involved in cell wall biosynthesis
MDSLRPGPPAVETAIVTFERGGGEAPPNEFVAAARELGLEVDVIPERRRFDLRVVRALRDVVERRRPDIVLTHHVKSHFVMRRAGLKGRVPWVAFHHGYTQTLRRERLYNLMDRLALPAADRVVTVCGAFARELERAGVAPERIHVQHNSISPASPASAEEARALRAGLGIGRDERVVLAAGRLSAEKAHADLLRAFRHLSESDRSLGARLVLVGDGPERGGLEALADALGLRGRVVFAGQVSGVGRFYAAADLLALPSHSEGSPYVLLEAMAAGLPVVATAVGGVPEMVEDEESALLVPAREPRELARAMARVLTDEALARRLASNAARLVATRYSPESYVNSLLEIYGGVLGSRTGRTAGDASPGPR